jgi:hypothetical protein
MTGTHAGLKTSILDYSYFQDKSRVTQTVAAYSQNLRLPFFEMHPKDFLDRGADHLFHQNISFKSHPDFSRRYLLLGIPPVLFSSAPTAQAEDNKNGIQELFSPALLSFLQELSPKNKWHIEGAGSMLVLYRNGATVGADEVRSFLDETSSIARAFFSLGGLKKPTALR